MSYYLAPSLVALRDEVDKRWPNRDKTSDGWIGDTSHQARPSDHNPDWSAGGVVRAIDIDVTDRDRHSNLAREVVKAAIGDPRVWYVIHQFPGQPSHIWSRTYGWRARLYTGSNPHDHHVHISIQHTRAAETDKSRWLAAKRRTKPLPISLHVVHNQMLAALGRGDEHVQQSVNIRRLQRALNQKYHAGLATDGWAGEATLRAWGEHERATVGTGRPRVPDKQSLFALVRPRFQMVD